MKKYLLPDNKKVYKANLHCHSNLSDGKMTPKELADAYYEHGYSVLSITDHEFFADHSDLNREDFLILTGYELQIVDPVRPRRRDQKCAHMCIISKDPHAMKHVLFNPGSYDLGRLCHIPEEIPNMKYIGDVLPEKYYDVELINEAARLANENGMLIAYNHPTWSLEGEETYTRLKGFYAMEIYNNDCCVGCGMDEYNPRVYDSMLRSGQRIACIATDDAHAAHPIGHPKCDLFGGWTNIYAESLSYENIIKALENQDFYASTGPEIRSLYYEDGKVYVKTDAVQSISLTTYGRRSECERAVYGETISEAAFSVMPDDGYIRITVKDAYGRPANTRGYFLDEFYD